jgi:hypothetical protein
MQAILYGSMEKNYIMDGGVSVPIKGEGNISHIIY